MKIFDAIKMGKEAYLDTLGEAILNIKIHACNLFAYDEMSKELDELDKQHQWLLNHRRMPNGKDGITNDTPIPILIQFGIGEDMVDYDMYYAALRNPALGKVFGNE